MAPSIAIIGNCQSGPLARLLRLMIPDGRITPIALERVLRDGDADAKALLAGEHDIILTQEVTREDLAPLRTDALRADGERLLVYPKVLFTGFHPDATYLRDQRRLVASPTGSFHSQILIGAHLAGLDASAAVKLFRGEVYEALDYFGEYPKALTFLLASGAATGFGLDPVQQGWLAEGAFMHTLNHPKPRVLASIARQALGRLEVPHGEADPDAITDTLAQAARWPVYPEIAERLGVPGAFAFTRTAKSGGGDLSLAEFTTASFELYRDLPREALAGALAPRAAQAIAAFA